MFDKPDICSACGGTCCRSLPGCALPEDFGMPEMETLVARLRTGRWAIDWWEGDPRKGSDDLARACFVRPATVGSEGRLFDPSYGGTCTFLVDTGCSLPSAERPAGCRMLEPVKGDGPCKAHGAGKQEAAVAWLPYADVLEHAESLR